MKKLPISISLIIYFITFLLLTAQHNWERTNPGGGGAIAVVGATADGTIIAASDLSGIYKSTNNGKSWEVFGATQGLMETSITSLGFHPTDGNTFIIGTTIGVYKTTNGGNTIYQVPIETLETNADGYVESIGMALSDNTIGYLAHYENWYPILTFMKTIDGGESWKIVNASGIPTDARIVKILVDQNNSNLVYALAGKARFGCTDPNLYKSINGGSSWTRIGAEFPAILDFDLHPTDTNIVYLSTFKMSTNGCDKEMWQYVDDNGKFYKSENGGTSFIKLFDVGGIISVGENPDSISIVNIINTSSESETSGTFRTNDGGNNWLHTGLVKNWFKGWSDENFSFVVSFNGLSKTLRKDRFNPKKMYGSFGQWAWSTIDGGDYLDNISTEEISTNHFRSTGLENIEGNWLDVSDVNSDVVYVGSYDLGFWYSKNHGASWKRSLPDYSSYPDYVWWNGGGSNCNFVLNDPKRENVVWATFSAEQPDTKSSLFKSTEYGENWSLSNSGLKTLGFTMHGMSLDINSPVNNRTLYLTQEGDVFKSDDDGESWLKIFDNGGMKFTEVDKKNSQLIYAGGENGFWRSNDGGTHWEEVGLPEMRSSHVNIRKDIVPTEPEIDWVNSNGDTTVHPWEGIFEIKADPNIEDRVYAVVYGKNKGLYRSDDAGNSWNKIYTNSKMRGVAIAPQNSDVIYASSSLSYHSGGYDSTSLGFLVSYNAGATWSFVNDGMAWTNGGRMEIETGSSPHIWAWSPGTGIQHALIPNLPVGVEKDLTAPESKRSIYPNPVNHVMTIGSKNLLKGKYKIYNILGQVVQLNKLNFENKINVTNLAHGIYFLELNIKQKITLMKFIKR